MKPTIGKKQVYITITPAPKKTIKDGLKVYFSNTYPCENYELPITTTDIIKNKRRYYLPKGGIMKVIKMEINL